MEVEEERDYIPIATLSPPERLPQKMGSVESHFNISLTGRDKVTRQCPETTTTDKEYPIFQIGLRQPSSSMA